MDITVQKLQTALEDIMIAAQETSPKELLKISKADAPATLTLTLEPKLAEKVLKSLGFYED